MSPRFGSRQRTALVLTGEGTSFAYLAGVLQSLELAGVRIDLVIGRGAGAVAACFAAVNGRKTLSGPEGLVAAIGKSRPFHLSFDYRAAVWCLAASAAIFLSPALVGLVSLVALPVRVFVSWVLPSSEAAPAWLPAVTGLAERFYLPAIAVPVVIFFAITSFRWLASAIETRTFRLRARLPGPLFDLRPLASAIEAHLWPIVRGAKNDERPKDGKELGLAFRKLLAGSIGQHGYRELVFYALDSDSGKEVPFVLVKERYLKAAAERAELAGSAEPVDLSTDEGAGLLFDALRASVSPPTLAEDVRLRMPLGSRFGGEVHRFSSSLVFGGGTLADAVAFGAEQVIYACGSAPSETLSGSDWERLSSAGARRALAQDLKWADEANLPVFVVRPGSERLRPFELLGRPQPGGGERLTLEAVFAQGVRDAERLFIEPLSSEEAGVFERPDQTMPVVQALREDGPEEL